MWSVYELKPAFQSLLRPLVGWLAGAGVTANVVTIAATVLSLGLGAAIVAIRGAPAVLLMLPVLLAVRMGLNAIDGMLAREHGQKSRLGFVLNELGDVISDAALYLPFVVVLGPIWALPVVLFPIAEFAGVLALALGGERRYDGPMGKSDRAVVYSLLAVAAATIGVSAGWSLGLALAISGLAVVTMWRRVQRGLHA